MSECKFAILRLLFTKQFKQKILNKKMKILDLINFSMKKNDKKLSDSDFSEIESKLGYVFPQSFKEFYFKWNGGIPNKTVFVDNKCEYLDIEISRFIPMRYATPFKNDPEFTLEGRAICGWAEQTLPSHLIPFAIDWGGNYICLNKKDDSIVYYVFDTYCKKSTLEENFEGNSKYLCNSFEYYLSHLEDSSYFDIL